MVALPTLRIAGIYLALMTAAFAMLMDQWIFGLQDFSVGPLDLRLFGTGSVPVANLDVPAVGTERARIVFLAVVFAVLYLLVVAVRRSTYGQKLLALKDSPAATATLGINPALVKLSVFTLSAGIAGFGGALYGGTLGAISAQNFAFFQSLPLLLLAVVGGIGSAAGALAAGVLIGGLPLIVDVAPWFENINRVLPGTMGITLGRNPNGIVASLRDSFAPLRLDLPVLAATLGGVAAVVGLRLAEVVTGVPFAVLLVGRAARGRAGGPAAGHPGGRLRPPRRRRRRGPARAGGHRPALHRRRRRRARPGAGPGGHAARDPRPARPAPRGPAPTPVEVRA